LLMEKYDFPNKVSIIFCMYLTNNYQLLHIIVAY
jgi:hypothetical protein